MGPEDSRRGTRRVGKSRSRGGHGWLLGEGVGSGRIPEEGGNPGCLFSRAVRRTAGWKRAGARLGPRERRGAPFHFAAVDRHGRDLRQRTDFPRTGPREIARRGACRRSGLLKRVDSQIRRRAAGGSPRSVRCGLRSRSFAGRLEARAYLQRHFPFDIFGPIPFRPPAVWSRPPGRSSPTADSVFRERTELGFSLGSRPGLCGGGRRTDRAPIVDLDLRAFRRDRVLVRNPFAARTAGRLRRARPFFRQRAGFGLHRGIRRVFPAIKPLLGTRPRVFPRRVNGAAVCRLCSSGGRRSDAGRGGQDIRRSDDDQLHQSLSNAKRRLALVFVVGRSVS